MVNVILPCVPCAWMTNPSLTTNKPVRGDIKRFGKSSRCCELLLSYNSACDITLSTLALQVHRDQHEPVDFLPKHVARAYGGHNGA